MISLSWLTLLSLTPANLYLILRPHWQPDFNFSVTAVLILRLWTWTISYGWDPFVLHGIEMYCLLQNCIAWYWICITMVYFVSHVKHRTTHGFSISGQVNQSHNNSHLQQWRISKCLLTSSITKINILHDSPFDFDKNWALKGGGEEKKKLYLVFKTLPVSR